MDAFADRYEIQRELGRGASAIVLLARDRRLGREVALKILLTHSGDGADHDAFLREADLLASLSHPAIVTVFGSGSLDADLDVLGHHVLTGTPYVEMELLSGETLEQRQRRAPLGLRDALELGRQVAGALAHVHQAGVVHRDVKPQNLYLLRPRSAPPAPGSSPGSTPRVSPVIIDEPGATRETQPPPGSLRAPLKPAKPPEPEPPIQVKLVDFGVAAMGGWSPTGELVGTPAYMAPEQARGDEVVDARCDLYALGATLFELIAGRPPHAGATGLATMARLVTAPAPPRLSEVLLAVPEALDDLLARLLSPEPDGRPGSAEEVEAALGALLADPRVDDLSPITEDQDSSHMSGTRLVTTVVALAYAAGEDRAREIERIATQDVEVRPMGKDALVAHLGARRAHGDEAVRAVELARRLADAGARVGIATGRARVERSRQVGAVVDRATALAREATAANVLADPATVELARGQFEFQPVRAGVLRCVRPVAATDAQSAVFVGRDAEQGAVSAAYERCVDDRTPIVVTISGPPGIGKTRLVREVTRKIAHHDTPLHVLEARCEPFGKGQPLGVAADLLRMLFGLPKDTTYEQARAALGRWAPEGAPSPAAQLLANQSFDAEGVDGRSARDTLYVSLTEMVLHAASESSCAIFVEDGQWSDPESIAWLDHLLGRATGKALFVVLALRPGFWRDQTQRFAGRDHVRIELRPLGKRATREIARAVLGERATEELVELVAQQAAGSPLFAEELARISLAGKDARQAPTIEAAIQVSLDALDEAARDGVVRASAFGMRVWDLGIEAVGVFNPEGVLKKLVSAELLVEEAQSRFSNARQFLFKHALVRDVAYASAGDDLRRQLHAWAARWLDGMGEDPATVAQHYDLGGEHEEAAIRWERAARRALATNSLSEAVQMAERALAFAHDRPTAFARAKLLDAAHSRLDARSGERDVAIQSMQENVYDEASELRTLGARARYDDARGGGTQVEQRLVEVRDKARALGLLDEQAECSATLARRYAFAGDFAEAESEVRELLRLAEQRELEWAAVDAWQTLAVVRQACGELALALEARRNAARAARSGGLQEREAMLTMNLGFALTTLGAKEEALHEVSSGIAKAQAIGSSGAVRHGKMVLLCWAATFGADGRLDSVLADPRAQADEAVGAGWVLPDRATLGVLYYRGVELLRQAAAGDASCLPRARSLLKSAAESYRSTENRDVLPVALGYWAEAERRLGHSELARDLAAEAAGLVEGGAPSLLNEGPIFLALHDACVDLGDLRGAQEAVARAMPSILRRLAGLDGTPYARSFVQLPSNAALIELAEDQGTLPAEVEAHLGRRSRG